LIFWEGNGENPAQVERQQDATEVGAIFGDGPFYCEVKMPRIIIVSRKNILDFGACEVNADDIVSNRTQPRKQLEFLNG
jgi:hypothetical protein